MTSTLHAHRTTNGLGTFTKRFYSLALAMFCLWNTAYANNIEVTSLRLGTKDNTANTVMVNFNLTWENSWRTSTGPSNWDAAWVFVKYKVGSGDWQHARLNDTDHSASGSTIYAGLLTPGTAFHATDNPALGVFIYRNTDGTGTNTFDTQLRWNYGANGVADNAQVTVKVFAIEMVYVPQGSFYVGSGALGGAGESQEIGSFTNGSWTSGATIPYQITSEAALGIDNVAGKLWGCVEGTVNGGIGNMAADAEATLAATYPKGTAAFYCMKYELSQGQYRDFLNTLTRTQQNNRTGTDLSIGVTSVTNRYAMSNSLTLTFRNGIRCDATIDANNPINFYCDNDGDGTPNETTDGEWIACNYLSWQDGAAYMDWAGLRPMTELEYEKACRGPETPVALEYAWGNATNNSANNIANGGQAGEVTSRANANSASANQSNVQGPMRVGAFAGAATSRAQAGATYYGIMEMSGNVFDRTVTVGNAAGRSYTGLHGDGNLFGDGSANVDFWPGINGNSTLTTANTVFDGSTGVTEGAGAGTRGSSWAASNLNIMKVSYRNNANIVATNRDQRNGWRGVRTAQ